jgi:hypothetical protein
MHKAALIRLTRRYALRLRAGWQTRSTMSAVPLFAHVGHWYLWVPYLIPVVIVLGASYRAFRQQRREDRLQQEAGKPNR